MGRRAGTDPIPARAPFAGRRSPQLAARLAAALGADVADTPDGWLVRRVVPALDIPVDRERLSRLPGHPPPDAPLVCLDTETTGLATAAGTLAFLVGLARWDGTSFRQTQLLLPDHADEPALLAEIARWVTPDTWLVSYNGRGFDWPLIEARYRMAGQPAPTHAGHLDLLPFVRRVFKHRMEDARLRTVEGELLGVSRIGDVEGWEIPSIYLDVLRGGPVDALAGVVIHNEKDVRSLGLLLAHVERRYAERGARHEAPRGDLAGLSRAYTRERRHDEALECLDDALAAPAPVRDPFGRTPPPRPLLREQAEEDAWWQAPASRPHFGGQAPRGGWRGELANGRGGGLGPAPGHGVVGHGTALDGRAGCRRTGPRAAPARSLGGVGGGVADRGRGRRPARGDRLDRGREAARAPPRRSRGRPRRDPGGVAAAGATRMTGRPHPRLEADLDRRGRRLAARLRRRASRSQRQVAP